MSGRVARANAGALALRALALCLLAAGVALAEGEPAVDPGLFDRLEARMIGPYRGGRVTAVTGVPQQPFTFYMGSTGGGVWKTTNAGESWRNVTDGFLGVGSVGAVAVAPSDPNVVYVGTGSACPRGNVSTGDGLYRSTDAGATWQRVGLERAGLIGRVRVHPTDPDLVWVAVLGQIFGPNEERGVYRSRDGGASWERVLFVSEQTGAVDLALDPSNPRRLFAAAWRAERKPWTLIDGGEESGLYRSTDGGDSWVRLEGGLPGGELGRIGVAVSPADPDRVWALVSADGERGALYRSDDGGDSWSAISRDRDILTRGWYYSHLTADPKDPNTVWTMNVGLLRSIDGGKTFSRVRTPHGDNHDLWINPLRPGILIEGNDGGANVSLDGGATWSTLLNQPTAEMYRVVVDNQFPFRVYGAQQDNSTISIPSSSEGDITPKQRWYSVAGAESGHIAVDPRDPNIVYAGNYLGRIDRYDHRTGYSRNMILYPQMQDGTAPRDLRYRFQWNAPIVISRWDPDVVYHGSNYVHRTRDGGLTWETISPDLTRDDPEKQELPGGPVQHDHTGVEVFGTVFTIAESPLVEGVLWVGSDDGLVHLSRDRGATWSDVTPPGLPLDATVNAIEASRAAPGRAYVAAHRYRLDDWQPYLYRTDDWGQTWRRLVEGIPEDHPVRVVREDPDHPRLLFAGTEFGLFASFDAGERWQPMQLNLPRTPISDLAIHDGDLVIATQGRSFWIVDDLEVLEQAAAADTGRGVVLFAPARTVRVDKRGFRGPLAPKPKPPGAVIWFWLENDPEESVEADSSIALEILDQSGALVRRYRSTEQETTPDREHPWGELEVDQGLNRFEWDLTGESPRVVEGAVMSLSFTGGARVVPGTYRVRLRVGDESLERSLVVVADPRLDVDRADLQAQHDLALAIGTELTGIHDRIRQLRAARSQSRAVLDRARAAELDTAAIERLETEVETLAEQATAAEQALIQTKNQVGQDPINFPPKIDNQFAYLYTHVIGSYGRPTEGAYQRFEDLEQEVAPLLAAADEVLSAGVAGINASIEELGLGGVVLPADE